ncbi:Predicted arabinose efflux permease, MFS family [Microbacterium sp. cf046]|uniref:MFS transporter n=1 Tax=Microbacterium sp. cf046 TaxID=1761803 RepID=UPI0008E7B4BE|nr:MFS transporter [Microbacterium sp. cf046]SFS03838.1 Predicted arabinose efflux permease, MFS family [Microbacterium sp. cf046]
MTYARHARGSTPYRRILVALFFAGVATFAQLYSPQGVLPAIAEDVGVSPATASLTISVATAGVALSVLPWAFVAERIGRARAMSIAVAAAALLGVLVPFAPTFEVLLVGRFFEGVALGAIPTIAMAYLSDEIVADHSPRAAGVYVAGTTIGGLLGRVVAGPIADATSWRIGVLLVAAVCAASAIAFVVLIPRARRDPRLGRAPTSLTVFARRLLSALRRPSLLALYAHPFLLMGAFVALYNYIGFRLEAPPFALSTTVVSLLYFAYLAGTWSAAQVGGWTARFGRISTLLACLATMAGGILLTISPEVPVIIAGIALATAGFFAAHAIVAAWVPSQAPDAAGEASAIYSLSYYLGSSVLGWAAGLVFAAAGWWATAATLAAFVGGAAVIAVLSLRMGTPRT